MAEVGIMICPTAISFCNTPAPPQTMNFLNPMAISSSNTPAEPAAPKNPCVKQILLPL